MERASRTLTRPWNWSFMILCLHTCLVYFSIFGNAGSKEHYAAVRRDGAAPRQYAFLDPTRGALKSYEGSIFHLPPAWILQSRHFPGLRRKCDWRVPPPRFYRAPRYARQNLYRCRGKITTKLKNFRESERSSSRFASRGTSSSDSRASDSCDRSGSSSSRSWSVSGRDSGASAPISRHLGSSGEALPGRRIA